CWPWPCGGARPCRPRRVSWAPSNSRTASTTSGCWRQGWKAASASSSSGPQLRPTFSGPTRSCQRSHAAFISRTWAGESACSRRSHPSAWRCARCAPVRPMKGKSGRETRPMPKRALITGITGQDGSYLAELLLEKGYEVHGMVRRSSEEKFERIAHLRERIQLHQGDLLDQFSLAALLS